MPRALLLGCLACGLASVSSASTSYAIFAFSPTGSQELILNGTTILTAITAGLYNSAGANNTLGSGISNYLAGVCGSSDACSGNNDNFHDYFVFDLSGVTGPITSAELSIGNASTNGYINPASSEVYTSWDVTTPVTTLVNQQFTQTGIYNDLGSGVLYASTTVTAASDGTQVLINLDAAALAAIQAAEGGDWAVGGAVNATVIPEPASFLLVGGGLLAFAGLRRHFRS